ncbi:tgtA5 cluster protein 1 [Enhygromyxa salina]|uniref:TgtA5 cluster protein 1 n=1 Tax=Enhygromyxa salina TaxID=215803 RepID=A0A0C2DD13_9BACT|nr:tgtA5 cluster protein 1 [Enhygromyxa salina]
MIKVPAMEIHQSPGRKLYTFAIDGKHVYDFADVSRIRRNEKTELEGYQRPEVIAHIQEIKEYIESDSPMLPNGVVVAFDSRVKFKRVKTTELDMGTDTAMGVLEIPVGEDPKRGRVGFIVDGQQRLAAIRGAKIKKFMVLVSAFITDDLRQQTEQFILVNSTKPLPKGLIYELIPHTDARLPTALHRRRLAAFLLERLNHEQGSPLHKMIRTPTAPDGVIKDNSMLKMLGNSLSDGVLYEFRDRNELTDESVAEMLALLQRFWGAVSETFPDAWGKKPRESRLMHGAGIVSIGNLMDHIASQRTRRSTIPSQQYFRKHLSLVAPECAWTDGDWRFDDDDVRSWNQIQNTRQDVEMLTDFLQRAYDASA